MQYLLSGLWAMINTAPHGRARLRQALRLTMVGLLLLAGLLPAPEASARAAVSALPPAQVEHWEGTITWTQAGSQTTHQTTQDPYAPRVVTEERTENFSLETTVTITGVKRPWDGGQAILLARARTSVRHVTDDMSSGVFMEGCFYSGDRIAHLAGSTIHDELSGSTEQQTEVAVGVRDDGSYYVDGSRARLHVPLTGQRLSHIWDRFTCSPEQDVDRVTADPLAQPFDASLPRGNGQTDPLCPAGFSGSQAKEASLPGGPGWETLTWNLHRGPSEPANLDLVVEAWDYDDWLPEGRDDEQTPGRGLGLTARLQASDGGPPPVAAKKFIFELVGVSREPGIALNFPKNPAKRPDFDLRFDQRYAPSLIIAPNGQRAEARFEGVGAESMSTILSSFDWGAYGQLRVTAVLADCRHIVGYLKGQPGRELIPVPKRAADSLIGDAWPHGARPDNEDSDNDPVGDGWAGDGLTLYEEYRGFYENGHHLRTDPAKKDLFIRDKIGGKSKAGIMVFAQGTGLAVHHELTDAEIGDDRQINFNHATGPHVVAQHAVVLVVGHKAGISQASAVGTPGQVAQVEVWACLFHPNSTECAGYAQNGAHPLQGRYAHTVAHELGHAANIKHHGQGDDFRVRWKAGQQNGQPAILETVLDPASGQALGPSHVIRVLGEDGHEFAPTDAPIRNGIEVYVAKKGGQHSGDETCFMRYETADAYVSAKNAAVRYFTAGGEVPGLELCATKEGTGVNAPDHMPESRYGPATFGNCQGQLRANDNAVR